MPAPTTRRVTRALAGIAAGLLAAAGLSVAVAAPASAHTPTVSSTCDTLSVKATSYNAGATNTVSVSIDGETVEDATGFGTTFQKDYDLGDETVAHDYVVKIRTSDDPKGDNGWSVTKKGTSTPCAPEPPVTPESPTIDIAAQQCTVLGDTTGDITATVVRVDGREYTATVQLAGSDEPIATQDVTGDTVTFRDLPTGASYTVTVTDTESAEASTTSAPVELVECPLPVPTVTAKAETCTVEGGDAGSISAEFGVVENRSYTATVTAAEGGEALETVRFTTEAGQQTAEATFDELPTGADYVVTITDDEGGVHSTSPAVTVEPCPFIPPSVSADSVVTTCDISGDSVGTITAAVEGDAEHGFVVTLVDADGETVDTRTVDGPATVTFEGLPSGVVYTVTVKDEVSGETVSSDEIEVQRCLIPVEGTPTPEPTPPAPVTPEQPSTPAGSSVTGAPGSGSLASTGFDAAPIAWGGAALLLVGGATVFLLRRRVTG